VVGGEEGGGEEQSGGALLLAFDDEGRGQIGACQGQPGGRRGQAGGENTRLETRAEGKEEDLKAPLRLLASALARQINLKALLRPGLLFCLQQEEEEENFLTDAPSSIAGPKRVAANACSDAQRSAGA